MKCLPAFIAIAVIALLLPFLATAQAAPAPPTAQLTWSVPTYTDGTAITQPIAYNVYQGLSATALVKVASGVTAQTQTIVTGLSDGVTYYWSVSTVVGGVEGAQSNAASKTFAPGTPGTVVLTVK